MGVVQKLLFGSKCSVKGLGLIILFWGLCWGAHTSGNTSPESPASNVTPSVEHLAM